MLIGATVADIRSFKELGTDLFFVFFAQLIAKVTGGATFDAVRLVLAKVSFLAFGMFHASVADAVWGILVTCQRMAPDFS